VKKIAILLLILSLAGCANKNPQYYESALQANRVPYALTAQGLEGFKAKGPVASLRITPYTYLETAEHVEYVKIGTTSEAQFDGLGRMTHYATRSALVESAVIHHYHEGLLIRTERFRQMFNEMESDSPRRESNERLFYSEQGNLVKVVSDHTCTLYGYRGDVEFTKPCSGPGNFMRVRYSERGNLLERSHMHGTDMEVQVHGEESFENGMLKYVQTSYRKDKKATETISYFDEHALLISQQTNSTHAFEGVVTNDDIGADASSNRELIKVEYDQYHNPVYLEYRLLGADWRKKETQGRYVEWREYTYHDSPKANTVTMVKTE